MEETEFELTFLARELPEGLKVCEYKEIIDFYVPNRKKHPSLRIRKDGNSFILTRKQPAKWDDPSHQIETHMDLDELEFIYLSRNQSLLKLRKVRYFYQFQNKTFHIDIFQDELEGLVLVEIEFDSAKEKKDFKMPSFCLSDVTKEEFIAGGMLAGKSFRDIKETLDKFDYKRFF